MDILCPICKKPLSLVKKSLICSDRHTYDYAKEGYVNLLVVNKKNSLNPGDNKEMILARKNFLDYGYYTPLADKLAEIVSEYVEKYGYKSLIDIGCGTGYYTQRFGGIVDTVGIDISKYAIRTASKSSDNVAYFVASCYDLPLKNNSVDIITDIFAPKPENEFKRVLADNGIIIEVVPTSEHLIELKEVVYGNSVYQKETAQISSFSEEKSLTLMYKKCLVTSEIKDLFSMTPYFKKTSVKDIEKLDNIPELEVTFSFKIRILK